MGLARAANEGGRGTDEEVREGLEDDAALGRDRVERKALINAGDETVRPRGTRAVDGVMP